ncbi:response regulator [Rhizobium sp. Root274]|uniref:response regulator n=1 Tax=unclassified Rhizobium TaxID=2613769 RepID=UPI000714C14D|nr:MULTISPECIES: response regulator [unclassified Rhizobium]KQW27206.1 response regulator [Rhizobium sp. Root1240]KRD26684.1 response regulator [Rhizobium sp. Root274]
MKIMIVEDEALLALELEMEVEAAGHEVVGTAASHCAALEIVDQTWPQFAFVDVHLSDGPSGIDIGRHLASTGIPFVFVTGNVKRIPDDFAGAIGAIEKPYTMNGLQNALTYLTARVSGQQPSTPPPGLILAE